ncbi:MAG: biotin/lipoyl-binding protein [Saprospiraceae bacterium]|nr:biotin/lipoyl-binding protein [Saprospiraceae bacterium]
MKKYKFRIKGHDYEVEILSAENNHVELEVNGTPYTVEMLRDTPQPSKTPVLVRSAVPPPKPEESAIGRSSGGSATPLKSPLPGTITAVLVSPGNFVKKGDTLLKIEAMKMENNIHAEKPGKVTAVRVKPGDAVLQNDVLIEIEQS